MSTLRTDTLQTTDSLYTVPVSDIAAAVSLRGELANTVDAGKGSNLIGYKNGTVYSKLGDISTNSDVVGDLGVHLTQLGGRPLILKQGSFTTPLFHRAERSYIDGGGSTVLINSVSPSPGAVRIGDNSVVRNFVFECTNPDLNGSRGSLEVTRNATYDNCTFRNFKGPTSVNGWGLYAKNTKGATISNCKFSGNTTYDITLVDDVYNTTVRNVDSEDGLGCIMAIEPNGRASVNEANNTLIENSNFRQLSIMENAAAEILTYGTVVRNCKVGNLLLQGGTGVILDNVSFDTIASASMACELSTNCIKVGPELILDTSTRSIGIVGSPWSTASAPANSLSVTGLGTTLHDDAAACSITQSVTLSTGTYVMSVDLSVTLDARNAINPSCIIYGGTSNAHSKLFKYGEKGTIRGTRHVFFDVTSAGARSVGINKGTNSFTETTVHGVSLRKLSKVGEILPSVISRNPVFVSATPVISSSAVFRAKDLNGLRMVSTEATVSEYVVNAGVVKAVRYT